MWGLRSLVASEMEDLCLTSILGEFGQKLKNALTPSIFDVERLALPFWKALDKSFEVFLMTF